jgi:uncharacterized protein (DUF433 family)
MNSFERITHDAAIMGGQACIRGMRVTVSVVVGMIAAGKSKQAILDLYPYLESADVDEALAYAAWRMTERELPLASA